MPDKQDTSLSGNADTQSWLKTHGINEVECLVPDVNGVLRGKALPAAKFLKSLEDWALYLPSSAFLVAIDGRYSGSIDEGFAYQDPDMRMVPDLSTLSLAPAAGRAYVFADAFHMDDRAWMASPRHVLRAVLDLYRRRGWRAVMAPELEFYLTAPNPDPDRPLTAPVGRNGRPESVQHPYDMQALEEFEEVTRRLYDHAAAAHLPLDTLIHESGTAQLEINFLHGDPLALADKVLLFKRLARQAAQASGMHATFMAKPIAAQAGSSMHLHMSIVDERGDPLFAGSDGDDTQMFSQFIGGLQKYIPEVMPLFAPNVNSYRRIRPGHSAPANVEWSHDNRSCGLRVPIGGRAARRVENRLPGA
ncbi:glutamine synthetase family protein, partial [Mesorhizobium sp.]|uniref:glutamine synthetase family protein n=1 Tax=Mesorhizobium sp. TaxID=1871066 RepID=UPI0025BFD194